MAVSPDAARAVSRGGMARAEALRASALGQRAKPSISSLAQATTCLIDWPLCSFAHMVGMVARLNIGIAYSGGAG